MAILRTKFGNKRLGVFAKLSLTPAIAAIVSFTLIPAVYTLYAPDVIGSSVTVLSVSGFFSRMTTMNLQNRILAIDEYQRPDFLQGLRTVSLCMSILGPLFFGIIFNISIIDAISSMLLLFLNSHIFLNSKIAIFGGEINKVNLVEIITNVLPSLLRIFFAFILVPSKLGFVGSVLISSIIGAMVYRENLFSFLNIRDFLKFFVTVKKHLIHGLYVTSLPKLTTELGSILTRSFIDEKSAGIYYILMKAFSMLKNLYLNTFNRWLQFKIVYKNLTKRYFKTLKFLGILAVLEITFSILMPLLHLSLPGDLEYLSRFLGVLFFLHGCWSLYGPVSNILILLDEVAKNTIFQSILSISSFFALMGVLTLNADIYSFIRHYFIIQGCIYLCASTTLYLIINRIR